MVANPYQYTRNPLVIAEIVGLVIENVDMVPDLLNCACVNSIWTEPALRKLYRGSLNDMQFRTPGIDSLNCLLVASPGRFARNMSFVKHLLLAPEYPSRGCGNSSCRPLCFDVCRAMRSRALAELLLRTQPRGFTSLMIPFEMAHRGLELFSDHLGQETVEVVAINCTDLTRIICYPELGSPAGDFPNLKALTVYISEDDPELGGLYRLLRTRDLQFIHLEEWIGPHSMRHNYRVLSGKLLPYIRAHQNLRALVLDLAGCGNPLPEEGEEEELLWPRLKALYLHCAHDQWLLQLSKFKELQIFKLLGRRFASSFDNSRFRTAAVAKCKHLRVVEIPILSLFDHNDNNHGMNFLMDIVRGCPLLQRLSLPRVVGYFTRMIKEPQLFDLLSVLPRLEVLELGMYFWVYGTELQDLAHHCPRLTFLDLNGANLYVSLTQMSGTLPFRRLEFVRFKQILFKKPGYLMQEANFQTLATEWSRIFPKLRTIPCLAEFELDNDPSDGSEEDGASVRGDEKPSFPDADDDGTNSDWQSVRSKLWEALSYVEADEYASEKFQHMWQTNFEIETIGWPVLSSETFTYTWPHSFPPRGYC